MPVTYPYPNIRRLFAVADDGSSGGSSYENLSGGPGVIPDGSIFWPVNTATLDRGLTRIERTAEVRGRRAVAHPLPFRANPVVTATAPAYRSIVEKLARKCLGGTDTVTGSAGTGYTHTFTELGFGSARLPTLHTQIVRDDLNHKMSGGTVNRITMAMPLDAEATIEAEIHGLYYVNDPAAIPTATYTDVSDILLLRDITMTIDAQSTPIPDLQQFDLTLNNNVDPKWFSGRNVTQATVGASPLLRKLWFPSLHKLGAQLDISGTFTFGNVNTAQEIALNFGQIQKLTATVQGGNIPGSTGPVQEQITWVINAAELGTDSTAASALQARGDQTYQVTFGGFFSDTDSQDLSFTSLNGISSAIA